MKKLAFLLFLFTPLLCFKARQEPKKKQSTSFNLAFTTGYVFKHDDSDFNIIYKNGIQNIITVDACYYFLESIGIGSKVSYWKTKGQTTFLKNPTKLQEVPLTFYLRTLLSTGGTFQPYISLGGGAIFMLEKSYSETIKAAKGIGEFEVGLNLFVSRYFDVTAAFRYLFPRETFNKQKADIGGFDLRAGIGFAY